MKILVADDDPVFQMLLTQMLTEWGYDVLVAIDGNEAWKQVRSQGGPRLAIVDWVMPGLDGLEVCRKVRAERKNDYVYILLMTAKNKSSDLHTVMEAGADDYVTKPFSIRELLARVKAVLRRTTVVPKHEDQHSFGNVHVDLRRHRVLRSGKALEVSSKEFELLKYFICHSGETLTRDRLLEEVWGYENYPTTRTVDTHLVRLRQKLEPDPEQPQYFLTVHGTGYRFVG